MRLLFAIVIVACSLASAFADPAKPWTPDMCTTRQAGPVSSEYAAYCTQASPDKVPFCGGLGHMAPGQEQKDKYFEPLDCSWHDHTAASRSRFAAARLQKEKENKNAR